MFDYLQKFNKLPRELRDKVSSPAALAAAGELERKYGLNLAALIMKVMVKEIKAADLPIFLAKEFKLEENKAKELAREMTEKIFSAAADYLGIARRPIPEKKEVITRQNENIKPTAKSVPVPVLVRPEVMVKKDFRQNEAGRPAIKIFRPQPKEEIKRVGKMEIKKIDANPSFSAADEEEVKNSSRKLDGYRDDFNGQAEDRLKGILKAAEINFGSEDLANRFQNIIRTYLLGVRSRLETKETLKKHFMAGGLGFDEDSAEKVMVIAESGKEERAAPPHFVPRIRLPEDLLKQARERKENFALRDVEYNLAEEIKKKRAGENNFSGAPVPAPAPVKIPAEEKKKEEKEKVTWPEVKIESRPEERPAAKASYEKEESGKVKMNDIKFVPKVMGPLDELKFMDLINFRRLSPGAEEARKKIAEKIRLLESESYGRMMEGIAAWRQSPLNRLYLTMGAESIREGKIIEEIIKERRKRGNEFLTSEEFSAVMDLNKELRF